MPIPLTGEQHEISAGDYTAVVTELGAGLRELRHAGRPLLVGYQATELPPGAAGQLLIPWPNRVDGGRYTFDGKQLQLDLSEPPAGNAIHGLTRWLNWSAAEHEAGRVLMRHVLLGRTGYPFCLVLEAEYRLDPSDGLRLQVTARNEGSTRAPYGTGQHPYLTAGTEHIDECELTLPATHWLPSGDRGIPSGPPEKVAGTPYDFRTPRAVGDVRLDHALTGLQRDAGGRAWVTLARPVKGEGEAVAGTRLWVGRGYRWLQVFSGDVLPAPQRRRALAVEPMTCPPNAFVTGNDLLVLEPGDTVQQAWGARAIA